MRGPRKTGQPTGRGVFLDDALAYRFAKSFVNALYLTGRSLLIIGFDRLPGPFH